MITFGPVSAGFPPNRVLEALIGGGVALLVNALLPVDPERMVSTAAHPIFDESAAGLEETAAALDAGDFGRAQDALAKAWAIDVRVSGFKEALVAGRETARLAPSRRRTLGHLELYAAAADQIDLTVRHVRIPARSALGVVRSGAPAPEPLGRPRFRPKHRLLHAPLEDPTHRSTYWVQHISKDWALHGSQSGGYA